MPSTRDAPGAGVEPHRPAVEFALGVAGRAAQQRADARQHLFEMKRLGDVVVGAGVEALHLVAPAVARGEHQHRHGAAGPAPGFQHRDAVHLRQADVEDHGVVGLGLAEIVPLLAVEGAIDHVAGIGQRGGELPVEIRIVLDDEETHAVLRSEAADKLALHGIDDGARHFAIAAENCQHVDESLGAAAQARPHQRSAHAVLSACMATARCTTVPFSARARRSFGLRQAWEASAPVAPGPAERAGRAAASSARAGAHAIASVSSAAVDARATAGMRPP